MASILRHRRRNDFTILPNTALRDSRVSFRATGLLCYLLALPDGSPVDSEILMERKAEGRDAIRQAIRELIAAGYVRRCKEQDEHGHWVTMTEVTDDSTFLSPTTDSQAPATENPSSDRRLENRPSVDQALKALKDELQKENGGVATPNGDAAVLPEPLPPEQVTRNLDGLAAMRGALREARAQ